MLPGIGDLLAEGVDPVEGIEAKLLVPGAGIERRGDSHVSLWGRVHGADGHGSAGDVAGEALESLGVVRLEDLLGVSGEPGVVPGEERVAELLAQSLGGLKAGDDESAEELFEKATAKLGQGEEVPSGRTAPSVRRAWRWGWKLAKEPKVWMETTMPGTARGSSRSAAKARRTAS